MNEHSEPPTQVLKCGFIQLSVDTMFQLATTRFRFMDPSSGNFLIASDNCRSFQDQWKSEAQ